jgi:hypothetical protein
MEKGSRNGPDHLPQKGVGPDFKDQGVALDKKGGPGYMAAPGFAGIAGARKNGTVPFPQDQAAVGVEQFYPGTAPELEGITAFMGKGMTAADKMVTVNPPAGVKAGVEIQPGFGGPEDPQVPGEKAVQGGNKTLRPHIFYVRVKVRRLARGVNPRVSTARSGEDHFFFVYLFQGLLKFTLYCPALFLPLPAGKIRTIVSDKEPDIPFRYRIHLILY